MTDFGGLFETGRTPPKEIGRSQLLNRTLTSNGSFQVVP